MTIFFIFFFHTYRTIICQRSRAATNSPAVGGVYSSDAIWLEISSSSPRCGGPSSSQRPSPPYVLRPPRLSAAAPLGCALMTETSRCTERYIYLEVNEKTLSQTRQQQLLLLLSPNRTGVQRYDATHSSTSPSRVVTYL